MKKMIVKYDDYKNAMYVDSARTTLVKADLDAANAALTNVDMEKAIPFLARDDREFAWVAVWAMTMDDIVACKADEVVEVKVETPADEEPFTGMEIDGEWYGPEDMNRLY